MKIDCVADLHGHKPNLPGGDLLIIAGDLTSRHTIREFELFVQWLNTLDYAHKIIIGGNHDTPLVKEGASLFKWAKDCQYLLDEGTEIESVSDCNRLKIWGTPWTPWFHGVNPNCKAFMKSDHDLQKYFNLIPEGLDILITHGPMRHILDANYDGYACGSQALREAVDRARPRFHVFGHIHEQGNNQLMYKHEGLNTWCVNCSYVDENYKPVNSHYRIEIK